MSPTRTETSTGSQAAAAETGGTFAQLGTGGTAEEVVEAINELEAAKIDGRHWSRPSTRPAPAR